MKLYDIPRLVAVPNYQINVSISDIESAIEHYADEKLYKLVLEPEFQRGHVWTQEQRIAYCEFILRGGASGCTIIFNCAGWMKNFVGPMYLVDGLQRLTSLRMMLKGEVPVFGHSFLSYEDHRVMGRRESLTFQVGDLRNYADVLRWYLEMNSGGTPHSAEEIARVTALWEQEKSK